MSDYDYVTTRSGYGRGLGHHTYVTKVEAFVEKVPSNYGRPPEVDELLSKILTEVNGLPPTRTSGPYPGTGRGRSSLPVLVESGGVSRTDPWYTYPGKVDPGKERASGYNYGKTPIPWEVVSEYEVPDRQHGSSSSHGYDRLPERVNYSSPINQWVRSSNPGHDYRPQRDYGVPNNRWGNSSVKPETPKNHGAPNSQWGDPPARPYIPGAYQVPDYSGAPKNQWGNSPKKTQTQEDYGAPSYLSRIKLGRPNDHGAPPNNQSSSSPMKPQAVGGYVVDSEVPKKQWGSSSNDQRDRPLSPNYDYNYNKQSPTELDTPKDYPNKQWSDYYRDNEVPDKQWDRPPSPVYNPQPPKVSYGSYDDPKGNNHPMTKPTGYPDGDEHKGYGSDEWRPNPYSLDHQPQDYGRSNKTKLSGYPLSQTINPPSKGIDNIGDTFGKLTVDDGNFPEDAAGAGRSLGRKQEALWGPADVDSREAERRYGGIPSRAYAGGGEELKMTISSKVALQKYNATFVPQ